MARFDKFFPPPAELIDLETEEVASFLLSYLCSEQELSGTGLNVCAFGGFNRNNFVSGGALIPYAQEHTFDADKIGRAITEAWSWLQREIMLAPLPGKSDWEYVTTKGFKYRQKVDLETYRKGALLPKEVLDKVFAEKVYPLFLRGDYDTAVFQAFKEVEIRVRKQAKLTNSDYGVDLMRKAFNIDNGKLSKMTLAKGERQAMSDLFAGAIGLFKNPSSHRDVKLDDPSEAAEIILFASYLLRLIRIKR